MSAWRRIPATGARACRTGSCTWPGTVPRRDCPLPTEATRWRTASRCPPRSCTGAARWRRRPAPPSARWSTSTSSTPSRPRPSTAGSPSRRSTPPRSSPACWAPSPWRSSATTSAKGAATTRTPPSGATVGATRAGISTPTTPSWRALCSARPRVACSEAAWRPSRASSSPASATPGCTRARARTSRLCCPAKTRRVRCGSTGTPASRAPTTTPAAWWCRSRRSGC